jgi:glycosyltransferase involved in cell wall biosynthesis
VEQHVLRQASALVTPSRQWQAELARRFHDVPCHAIAHGFDRDDYVGDVISSAREFTLTYTGSLNRVHQDPSPLFAALGDLTRDGSIPLSSLRVNFFVYGSNLPDIASLAQRYRLRDVVRVHPPLDHRDVLAAQQASTVLLLFQWSGAPGIEYVKAYEYLGAGRPMLVVGSGEGAIGDLIARTRCGIAADQPGRIAAHLLDWYREYERTGSVAISTDPVALARESRLERTRSLAAVLDAAVTAARERPR